MRLNPLLIGILCLISSGLLSATADDKEKQLLDSASSIKYIDYEKTMAVLDEAEQVVRMEGNTQAPGFLLEVLKIRIISTRYFVHLSLCRQYLLEAKELILKSKKDLGDQYEQYLLDNDLSWGEYYYKIEDNYHALAIFSTSIERLRRRDLSTDNCLDIYSTTSYIAAIQFATGENEAAINQYLASIPYYECYRDKSKPPNYSLIYRNVGQVYLAKKQYKEARRYFTMAEESLATYIKQPNASSSNYAERLIVLHETIAAYYRAIGKQDSSLISFQKVIPFLAQNEPNRGRVYLGLGEVLAGTGKFKQAQEYFNLAAKFFLEAYGPKNLSLSKTYMVMGDLYQELGEFESSLSSYQKSMNGNVLDFEPNAFNNPSLHNILSKKQLFTTLQKKSQLLWKIYGIRKDTSILKSAWATNKLALALLDSTANEFSLDKDKVILTEQSFSAFDEGIQIAYTMYQQTNDEIFFENCFSLTDKSKGRVLLEKLRVVNQFAGISPELLIAERELKSELLLTEQGLYKEELKKNVSSELPLLRERYSDSKRHYAALIGKIKKEAPDYYHLRFDHQVISTQQMQRQLLRKGEALVEYFVGDSALTIFGFSSKHRYLKQKKMTNELASKVVLLRNHLTSPDDESDQTEFRKTSNDLYDYLLRDCLLALDSGINSLIIVPDGLLGYVPFEVLIRTRETEAQYLGFGLSIRYAYSASYLSEQVTKLGPKPKYFFAGFVSAAGSQPINGSTATSILKGAQTEVASIAELLGSGYQVFNPATKKEFQEKAGDYKVLHLAMHSQVNDKNPMLSTMVFSASPLDSTDENLLTALELYNMRLNADMAVLSSCNTGFGEMHRGEGIMSFSRAFAYAGVTSAVISLWPVDDKATSRIMVNFYRFLKEGKTKDQALQLAKATFVKDYPQMAHPFFWSGFILTGNNDPLRFPVSEWWYWLIAFILLAAVVGLAAKKGIGKQLFRSGIFTAS